MTLKQAEHLLLAFLELGDLALVLSSDLFYACFDSLLDSIVKWDVFVALALHEFILVLKLLLDSQEAVVDLLLQVLDLLVGVSRHQAALVFFLSVYHQQVLVAEGVLAQGEPEEWLVLIIKLWLFDELQGTFGRAKVTLRDRRTDVRETIKGQLRHHPVLTLSLDPHLSIIEAFHHRHGNIEHDISEEHACADERDP